MDLDQTLIFWIRAFLTNRFQAVRVGGTLSSWRHTYGGVSQGTKLGVTLFTIMINRLLRDWHLRVKFVDDATTVEVIPRNSISILDLIVRDIRQYCINHNMKFNSKKCKDTVINPNL